MSANKQIEGRPLQDAAAQRKAIEASHLGKRKSKKQGGRTKKSNTKSNAQEKNEIAALKHQVKKLNDLILAEGRLNGPIRASYGRSIKRAMMRFSSMINPRGPARGPYPGSNALVPFFGKTANLRTVRRAFEGRIPAWLPLTENGQAYYFLRATNNPFSPVQTLVTAPASQVFFHRYDDVKKSPYYGNEPETCPTPTTGTAQWVTFLPLAHSGRMVANQPFSPSKPLQDNNVVPSIEMKLVKPTGATWSDNYGMVPCGVGANVAFKFSIDTPCTVTYQWFESDGTTMVYYAAGTVNIATSGDFVNLTRTAAAAYINVIVSVGANGIISDVGFTATTGASPVGSYVWAGNSSNLLEGASDCDFSRQNGLEVLVTNFTAATQLAGNIVQAYVPTSYLGQAAPSSLAGLFEDIATFPKADTRDASDVKGGWSCAPTDPGIPFLENSNLHTATILGAEQLYIAIKVTDSNPQVLRIRYDGGCEIMPNGNSPILWGQASYVPLDLVAEQIAVQRFDSVTHHFDNPDHPLKILVDELQQGVTWVNGQFKVPNKHLSRIEDFLVKASGKANVIGHAADAVIGTASAIAAMFDN